MMPMIIDNLSKDRRIERPIRDRKMKQMQASKIVIVPFASGLNTVRLTFLS